MRAGDVFVIMRVPAPWLSKWRLLMAIGRQRHCDKPKTAVEHILIVEAIAAVCGRWRRAVVQAVRHGYGCLSRGQPSLRNLLFCHA